MSGEYVGSVSHTNIAAGMLCSSRHLLQRHHLSHEKPLDRIVERDVFINLVSRVCLLYAAVDRSNDELWHFNRRAPPAI